MGVLLGWGRGMGVGVNGDRVSVWEMTKFWGWMVVVAVKDSVRVLNATGL